MQSVFRFLTCQINYFILSNICLTICQIHFVFYFLIILSDHLLNHLSNTFCVLFCQNHLSNHLSNTFCIFSLFCQTICQIHFVFCQTICQIHFVKYDLYFVFSNAFNCIISFSHSAKKPFVTGNVLKLKFIFIQSAALNRFLQDNLLFLGKSFFSSFYQRFSLFDFDFGA